MPEVDESQAGDQHRRDGEAGPTVVPLPVHGHMVPPDALAAGASFG